MSNELAQRILDHLDAESSPTDPAQRLALVQDLLTRATAGAGTPSAYVPNAWVCATCGFVLVKSVLRASDGAAGIDTSDVTDICSNDGTSLRRQTWQEHAQALEAAVDRLLAERGSADAGTPSREAQDLRLMMAVGMLHEAVEIAERNGNEPGMSATIDQWRAFIATALDAPAPGAPTRETASAWQPTTSSIGRGAATLRRMFDLTLDLAHSYGDNLHHCTGEQADRQFARLAVKALVNKPLPAAPPIDAPLREGDEQAQYAAAQAQDRAAYTAWTAAGRPFLTADEVKEPE